MILPFSPKVERDKTVATKESGSERSSGWGDSNETKSMVGKCVPVYSRGGVVQISDNKTIDTKLQAVVYLFQISDRLFTY